MVSRDHESAVYRQIARTLRDRIRSGELEPGQVVGPEKRLAHEFEVSAATIGEALRVLREEGWLEPAESGQVARVAEPAEIAEQPVPRASRIHGRRATAEECRDMGLRPGASVFEVTTGATMKVYPQDGMDLTTA